MKKSKRDIFGELMSGAESMRKHREGKVTLRTHKPEELEFPKVDARFIRETRAMLGVSQGVFAAMLRVNSRTLANWEQGRSKPNEQAETLILLVRNFPDTLKRLRKLAA